MKKSFLSFLIALGFVSSNVYGEIIPLTVRYDDDTPIFPFPHKQPVHVPEVDLSNHVLTFSETTTQDYTLILLDQNGEVVFEAFVMAATSEVVLPNDGGTYELQLHTDSWYYFVSTITI